MRMVSWSLPSTEELFSDLSFSFSFPLTLDLDPAGLGEAAGQIQELSD